MLGLCATVVKTQSFPTFPMQDEPEAGACFQHKMSPKGKAC